MSIENVAHRNHSVALLLFATTVGISWNAFSQSAESCLSESLAKTVLTVLDSRNLALDGATRDLKQFCEWNRMERAAKALPAPEQRQFESAFTRGDKTAAEDILIKNWKAIDDGPWEQSMLGSGRVKTMLRPKLCFQFGPSR